MNRTYLVSSASLLAGIWYFLFACPAHAYFDVNMGTYVIQVIFGFGAAFWFAFVNSWKRRWTTLRQTGVGEAAANEGESLGVEESQ